jgi:low affinity Fe/Cu permease
VVWGISGPFFGFSDTWQLLINSGTSIVTFLMVFLIQRAQNKDSQAIHLKLNELIAAVNGASNNLINAESLDEERLKTLHDQFCRLADHLTQSRASTTEAHSIDEAPTGPPT